MSSQLRLFPLAVVAATLVACGGGGGGGSTPSAPLPSYTITDGHVKDARAFCIVDPLKSFDVSPNFSAVALSDVNGQFKFSQSCNYETMAFGGTYLDVSGNPVPLVGILRSPKGGTVLTPLTTLMAGPNGMTESQVIASYGLSINTKLLTTDPASGNAADAPLLKSTLAVQQLLLQSSQMLAKLGGVDTTSAASPTDVAAYQAIYESVAVAASAAFKSPVPFVDSNGNIAPLVVTNLIKNAVTGAGAVNSNVQVAVTKAGVNNLATATASALTSQAQLVLSAPAANLSTVVTNMQANTAIADAIVAAVNGVPAVNGAPTIAPTLTTTTTSTAVSALANTLSVSATSTTTAATTTTTLAGSTTSTTLAPATTTTTTTTSTTTTTLPVNYLYLSNSALSYDDGTGAAASSYTLAQFQSSPGIAVKWPMNDNASLSFALAESGAFVAPTGTVTAALSITDTATSGVAKVKAYIDNVTVTKDANGIALTVPTTATTWFYAMAPNGSEVRSSFAATANTSTPLLTSGSNKIALGSLVKSALSRIGGMNDVSGKYRVTLVLNNLSVAQADGKPLTNYTVDVPVANGSVKSVNGVGVEGFMTVINPNAPVATTSTTTTTTTTTSSTLSPNNYLYLSGDSLGFNDGTSATTSTMAQFQSSPGVALKWPLANTASISFKLAQGSAFDVGTGRTVAAAIEIADTNPAGLALLKAYVDSVRITKTGGDVTVTVPSTAYSRIYTRSADGSEMLIGFADWVAGVNNTFNTDAANTTPSSIVMGSVINNALTRIGNVDGLTGKTYKVKLVMDNLQLGLSTGVFGIDTVMVPGSNPAISVTGTSLSGFITLNP